MANERQGASTYTTVVVGVCVAIVVIALIAYAYRSKNNGTGYASPTPSAASTSTSPSASGSTSSASHAIDIANFAFAPQTMIVHVGDTITWTNSDSMAHTVTSTDGGPLNSGNIAQGGSYSYTFTKAGTYTYDCTIHTYMTGTITVQ